MIQDILRDLGVEFLEAGAHHHTRPGWLQMDCPFCGPNSKSFHLGYNLQGRYFNCWRCGSHHPVYVLTILGLSREAALAFFRDKDTGPEPVERKRLGLKEPAGRGDLLECHREYLESVRGLDADELIRLWHIEGIGLASRLSWRIYIPIIYRDARVSWTTRAIGLKVEQRYLSASPDEEAINHRHLVYGLDYCCHSIVIVEGPIDAWAIGPGAGALFGTAFSTAQVRKILKIPFRFVCFDSSSPAQARANELCSQLACFPGVTTNIQIDAKDPGSADQRELKRLRRAAKL